MITNPFEDFYLIDVKVIQIKKGGGYSDRGTETITELASFKADMQPYNGSLAEREYGLHAECQMCMYCDDNEYLAAGNYVEAGGIRYEIIYIERWNSGAEVLLREVRL